METGNELVLFGNWLHKDTKETNDKRYKVLSNTGKNRREDWLSSLISKDFDSTRRLMYLMSIHEEI